MPWTPCRVRRLRLALELTQGQLAAKFGYRHRATVCLWEKTGAGHHGPTGPARILLDDLERQTIKKGLLTG